MAIESVSQDYGLLWGILQITNFHMYSCEDARYATICLGMHTYAYPHVHSAYAFIHLLLHFKNICDSTPYPGSFLFSLL